MAAQRQVPATNLALYAHYTVCVQSAYRGGKFVDRDVFVNTLLYARYTVHTLLHRKHECNHTHMGLVSKGHLLSSLQCAAEAVCWHISLGPPSPLAALQHTQPERWPQLGHQHRPLLTQPVVMPTTTKHMQLLVCCSPPKTPQPTPPQHDTHTGIARSSLSLVTTAANTHPVPRPPFTSSGCPGLTGRGQQPLQVPAGEPAAGWRGAL